MARRMPNRDALERERVPLTTSDIVNSVKYVPGEDPVDLEKRGNALYDDPPKIISGRRTVKPTAAIANYQQDVEQKKRKRLSRQRPPETSHQPHDAGGDDDDDDNLLAVIPDPKKARKASQRVPDDSEDELMLSPQKPPAPTTWAPEEQDEMDDDPEADMDEDDISKLVATPKGSSRAKITCTPLSPKTKPPTQKEVRETFVEQYNMQKIQEQRQRERLRDSSSQPPNSSPTIVATRLRTYGKQQRLPATGSSSQPPPRPSTQPAGTARSTRPPPGNQTSVNNTAPRPAHGRTPIPPTKPAAASVRNPSVAARTSNQHHPVARNTAPLPARNPPNSTAPPARNRPNTSAPNIPFNLAHRNPPPPHHAAAPASEAAPGAGELNDNTLDDNTGGQTEGKRARKSYKLKLTDFDEDTQPVLERAVLHYGVKLATINAFPDKATDYEFQCESFTEAEQHYGDAYIVKLTTKCTRYIGQRNSTIRGLYKNAAKAIAEAEFGFKTGSSLAIREDNKNLVKMLTTQLLYTYEIRDPEPGRKRNLFGNPLFLKILIAVLYHQDDALGFRFAEAFSPCPLPLIALIACAILNCIHEYEKGIWMQVDFTAKRYHSTYATLLASLNDWNTKCAPRVAHLCRTLIEQARDAYALLPDVQDAPDDSKIPEDDMMADNEAFIDEVGAEVEVQGPEGEIPNDRVNDVEEELDYELEYEDDPNPPSREASAFAAGFGMGEEGQASFEGRLGIEETFADD